MSIYDHTNYVKLPAAVAELAAKLKAGAYTRCPSCLNWIGRNKAGSLALFVPYDKSKPIPYAICKRCARDVTGDAATQRALTDRCEAYLQGEAVQP